MDPNSWRSHLFPASEEIKQKTGGAPTPGIGAFEVPEVRREGLSDGCSPLGVSTGAGVRPKNEERPEALKEPPASITDSAAG